MNPAFILVLCAAAAALTACERMAALGASHGLASFEARCEALPPGRFEIVLVPVEATEDYSLPYADLARIVEYSSANHRTVGLTRAKFGYRSMLELDGLEDARGGRACARSRVRVEIASSSMTVYVAREYRDDSCREPLILEHERKHVAVFERYAQEVAPALERELIARIGGRVRYAATMAKAQDALKAELAAHLEKFMARARVELEARHAAVDTQQEYEMLAKVCGTTTP